MATSVTGLILIEGFATHPHFREIGLPRVPESDAKLTGRLADRYEDTIAAAGNLRSPGHFKSSKATWHQNIPPLVLN